MPLVTAEVNVAVDAVTARDAYISLHTADPGGTGANEASGGSPAYARKALSWGSASSGAASATQVTFDVPAGTYTHFGLWSAVTAGTYRGGNPLSQSETFGAQGQLKVTPTITGSAT